MIWHERYLRQAAWTRALRAYLFQKAGISNAGRVLEVGCGTGAVLREIDANPALYGLDIASATISECKVNAPAAFLTLGDAHSLPYPDGAFDVVYCHFLLLWVRDPVRVVQEMGRVGRRVLALAEPDYRLRVDKPENLRFLGKLQTEALIRQGANPSIGSKLGEIFDQAGIPLIETGPLQSADSKRDSAEWENEWQVVESDLAGFVPKKEINRLRKLDEQAWRERSRILHVPTFFAWGET